MSVNTDVTVIRVGRNAAQVVNIGGGGAGGITQITPTTAVSGFPTTAFLMTNSTGTLVTALAQPLIIDGNGGGSGGGGGGGGGSNTAAVNNADTVTIPAGAPVSVQAGGFVRASSPNMEAVGVLATATAAGVAGPVQVGGTLTLLDWSAVLGSVALSPKQLYYLDPTTPGRLTTTVPTAQGSILQIVGEAVSANTMALQLRPRVRL